MNPFKPFNTVSERLQSLLVLNPFGALADITTEITNYCQNKLFMHHDFRLSLIVGFALTFSALMLNAQANSAYYGALNDKAMFAKAQGILDTASVVAAENTTLYQAIQEGSNEDVPDDLAQQYAGSVLRLTNPVLASALGFDEGKEEHELSPLFDELEEQEAPPMEDLGKQVKQNFTQKLEKQAALIEETSSFKMNFISFANPIKLPNVSSRFGVRHGRAHAGTDFQAPVGTSIFAAAGGRVMNASLSGAYGNLIVVDHGNGIHTRYAHCSSILVHAGQTIQRGQLIGKVGSTGRSTGPHLHFEMLANSTHMNPEHFLPSMLKHKSRTVVMRRGFRKVSEL